MNTALSYIKYFILKMMDYVFYDMTVGSTTVGWIIVVCLIFGMVIKSVLVLPQSLDSSNSPKGVK